MNHEMFIMFTTKDDAQNLFLSRNMLPNIEIPFKQEIFYKTVNRKIVVDFELFCIDFFGIKLGYIN